MFFQIVEEAARAPPHHQHVAEEGPVVPPGDELLDVPPGEVGDEDVQRPQVGRLRRYQLQKGLLQLHLLGR